MNLEREHEKIAVLQGLRNQKWGIHARPKPQWMDLNRGRILRQRGIVDYYRQACDLELQNEANGILKIEVAESNTYEIDE